MIRIAAFTAALALGGAAQAATVVDGGFEIAGGSPFQTIFDGGTIGAWTVDDGSVNIRSSVDLINGYWQAAEGTRSIDLSGNTPGTISQVLTGLVVGGSYELFFMFSGNPDGRTNGGGKPTADVKIDGATIGSVEYDTTSKPQNTLTEMNWEFTFFNFVANSTTATLSFVSTSGDAYGIALDDVSIDGPTPIPLPAGAPLLLLGLGGLALVARRKRTA